LRAAPVVCVRLWRPPWSTLFPYTTLFRSAAVARPRSAEPVEVLEGAQISVLNDVLRVVRVPHQVARQCVRGVQVRQHDGFEAREDRKSTRLNSSHVSISYAVFCLKKQIIV